MQTVEVKYGQSLFDIALQATGSVLRVVELALINGLSMTDSLQAGQVLELPLPPNPQRGNSAGQTETVRYIADDLYLWYVRQMGGGNNTGGDLDLANVVKYTPQDSTEVQQQSARGNLGIEDGPVPNWSEIFLNELDF